MTLWASSEMGYMVMDKNIMHQVEMYTHSGKLKHGSGWRTNRSYG